VAVTTGRPIGVAIRTLRARRGEPRPVQGFGAVPFRSTFRVFADDRDTSRRYAVRVHSSKK
jgi:hypothetical protein